MDLPEMILDLQALPIHNKCIVWKSFMEKYKCDTICEVGIRFGKNFGYFIEREPKLAVAIDIWKDDGVLSRNDDGFKQLELDKQYDDFKERMKDKPFVKIYREYSNEAVKYFPDEYFDFVYIDADHTYEGSLEDIKCWYPKVKRGKILVGDDYRRAISKTGVRFGVRQAVWEFVKQNNLQFYVMPRYKWIIIRR